VKTFRKEEPNPFQKKAGGRPPSTTPAPPAADAAASSPYQTTPLADMIKGTDRRERRPQPKRTPLSSEPPRSFGRERQPQQPRQAQQQQQYLYGRIPVQTGTVMGGDPTTTTPLVATSTATTTTAAGGGGSKLADILKGSEEQRRRTQQQRTRSRATTPPPQPKARSRAPRSGATKTFTTMSSRYDDSFLPPRSGGGGGGGGGGGAGASNVIGDGWGRGAPWDAGAMNGAAHGGVPPPTNNDFGAGYAAPWDGGAATSAQRSYSSAAAERSGGAATQRPFEPAPFTDPGTHNAKGGGARASSSRPAGGAGGGGVGGVGPKRVPPQTPFTSPVTDGARRSGGGGGAPGPSASSSSSSSSGPFTPFTAPGKRSANGKPPPRKQATTSDPRRFNIKDTPDATQPFVGVGWSQAYVDQFAPYSPPLQVDPPPRDPDRDARARDSPYYFEPAPFSSPQPHAVHSGAFARPPRDKWNRVRNNNPSSPPPENSNHEQHRRGRQEVSKKGQRSGPSSPFDDLRDMFRNIKPGGDRKDNANKEEPRGYKSGNVEVLPSSDNGGRPSSSGAGRYQQDGMRQQALEVEIIDAKRKIKTTDWQFEDDVDIASSAEMFENARKGGPASAASSTFTTNNERSGEASTSRTDTADGDGSMDDAAQGRARELLATNPEILNIVIRAQLNGKLRKAVHDCMGDPKSFGRFWDDPIVGPILKELKSCI
jgi:hypothetical protein